MLPGEHTKAHRAEQRTDENVVNPQPSEWSPEQPQPEQEQEQEQEQGYVQVLIDHGDQQDGENRQDREDQQDGQDREDREDREDYTCKCLRPWTWFIYIYKNSFTRYAFFCNNYFFGLIFAIIGYIMILSGDTAISLPAWETTATQLEKCFTKLNPGEEKYWIYEQYPQTMREFAEVISGLRFSELCLSGLFLLFSTYFSAGNCKREEFQGRYEKDCLWRLSYKVLGAGLWLLFYGLFNVSLFNNYKKMNSFIESSYIGINKHRTAPIIDYNFGPFKYFIILNALFYVYLTYWLCIGTVLLCEKVKEKILAWHRILRQNRVIHV